MGLLNMLQNQGSVLTPYDGTTPSINPLATQQSTMHADAGGGAGYSLSGATAGSVNSAYISYLDGTNNILPQPSQLDLNGTTPPRYLDNLPE
jgi:hypothetical protein